MSGVRQGLPARRAHETFKFRHDGQNYTAGLGFFENGLLAEVFLDCGKSGSAVETNARDGAVALSLLLQHGCPVETIRIAMTRDAEGRPFGALGRVLDHACGYEK